MRRISSILLFCAALICASCSGKYEPSSRAEKEKLFLEFFGFSPPTQITNIQYRDVYSRHAMDGAWGRYMTFNFNAQVYSNIVHQRGFKLEKHFGKVGSGAEPPWWIETNQPKEVFVRNQNDTSLEEGFSFNEYVWYDTNSAQIYYHKYYAD